MKEQVQFEDLKGRTLSAVDISADKARVTFTTIEGESFELYHSDDCCETVLVEDVVGDLADLVGSPLTMAEEVTYQNEDPPDAPSPEYRDDSWTWTFYKLATVKGYVTLRWLGTSNGYYSESVTFVAV